MAVYGRDFYGFTKYGRAPRVEYGIEPFTAQPFDYRAIRVEWGPPVGDWEEFRLIRNRYGFAADEADGDIVLSFLREDGYPTSTTYVDTGLVGGSWYYYTIFIQTGGQWTRAGGSSGLSVRDSGISRVLWDRIPKYFRYNRRKGAAVTDSYLFDAEVLNPESYDSLNLDLRNFIKVLGWGVDNLREHQGTLLDAYDHRSLHLREFERLAQQLGVAYSEDVPIKFARSHVENAAKLAESRGTLEGLEEVTALSTGWGVDVDLSVNLFLSQDQAAFHNPTFEEWDSGVNYAAGQRVNYAGRIMSCISGAYGWSRRPPVVAEGTWNAYWVLVEAQAELEAANPASEGGGYSSWGAYDADTLDYAGPVLAIGLSSPADSANLTSNALRVTNEKSTTAKFVLSSALRRV